MKFNRRAADEFAYGAFAHTALRAKERRGLSIEASDYRKAIRAIKGGTIPLRKPAGEGRFIVHLKLRGRQVRAVYDVNTGLIVTVLPDIRARPDSGRPLRERKDKR